MTSDPKGIYYVELEPSLWKGDRHHFGVCVERPGRLFSVTLVDPRADTLVADLQVHDGPNLLDVPDEGGVLPADRIRLRSRQIVRGGEHIHMRVIGVVGQVLAWFEEVSEDQGEEEAP